MRVLTSVLLCALGCAPRRDGPATHPDAPAVPGNLADVVHRWVTAHPVWATGLGVHTRDHDWPDLSPAGIAAQLELIATLQQETDAFVALTLDDGVDQRIVRTQLELARFSLQEEADHLHSPLLYAGLLGAGFEELTARPFAAKDVQARAVIARLSGLKQLLADARANLLPKEAMRPHCEVALVQLAGLPTLLQEVIPKRLQGIAPELAQELHTATAVGLADIAAFHRFIEDEVLPQAQYPWRLGGDMFARKFALAVRADISPAEHAAKAEAMLQTVTTQLEARARRLAEVLLAPAERDAIARGPQPAAALVRRVLSLLSQWHATEDGLKQAVEHSLLATTAFVQSHAIVPLLPEATLEVIWTPPHMQGVAVAGLAAPGALETAQAALPSFYLVAPVPSAWDAQARESLLREYNMWMLDVLSIHEAMPGHFVQASYSKNSTSVVRQVFSSGAFVEGWAVYCERMMMDAGYAGQAPATLPSQLQGLAPVVYDEALRHEAIALHADKFFARTIANALLDYRIHVEGMNMEQALAFMVDTAFQEPGEARGKWTRAQVTATQLSTYFAGAQAFLALQDEARTREEAFNLGSFHARVLSLGEPPPETLPALLGWR